VQGTDTRRQELMEQSQPVHGVPDDGAEQLAPNRGEQLVIVLPR
jgi:hypothetical protein